MEGGATQAQNWNVKLGGGVLYAPKDEGSDKHELKALPYAEIIWKDVLFLIWRWLGEVGSETLFF